GLPFQPVVGTPTLPVAPLESIRSGNAADVRLVTGTTTDEFKLFGAMLRAADPIDDAKLHQRAAALGARGEEMVERYAANRPRQSPDGVWSAIVTDFLFRTPAIRMVEAQLQHRDDVFIYEFGHRSTAFGGVLGACHAIEIPFVFDNVHKRGVNGLIGDIGDA